jgi:quinol monooxygenase YgiN
MKRILATLSLGLFASAVASAQLSDYLDIYIAQAKPDKRAEFEALSRKIADANRKPKGDRWIAMETTYGEGNVFQFVSERKDYAAVDQSMKDFMGALNDALGPQGSKKLDADYNNTVVSFRSELRRRRWDLSINAPKDRDAYVQIVGNARWLRTIEVHVREGHVAQFEDQVKQVKKAYENGGNSWAFFVSQVVAGAPGNVYYISTLQPSFAAFDSAPSTRKLMGDEAFAAWEKSTGDTVTWSETRILRFLPELSSPPDAIAQTAQEFWNPKPVAMMTHKPKAAAQVAAAPQQ